MIKYQTSKELDLSISNIWIKLKNKDTGKTWYEYFDIEVEQDKFIRRSKYFTSIFIIDCDINCKDRRKLL